MSTATTAPSPASTSSTAPRRVQALRSWPTAWGRYPGGACLTWDRLRSVAAFRRASSAVRRQPSWAISSSRAPDTASTTTAAAEALLPIQQREQLVVQQPIRGDNLLLRTRWAAVECGHTSARLFQDRHQGR